MRLIFPFLVVTVFLYNCSIINKKEDDSKEKNLLALYLISLNTDPLSKSWKRTSKENVTFTYKSLNTTGTAESPFLIDNIVYYSASNIVWYASYTQTEISSTTCNFNLSGTASSTNLKLTVNTVTNCSTSFPVVANNTFDLTYKLSGNLLTLSADPSTNSAALGLYGLTGLTSTISNLTWSFKY